MITSKIQIITLALITALVIMAAVIMDQTKIDCTDPQVWGTTTGVQHCAINGGK